MGTHPIFESDFDCLTEKCDSHVHLRVAPIWPTCHQRSFPRPNSGTSAFPALPLPVFRLSSTRKTFTIRGSVEITGAMIMLCASHTHCSFIIAFSVLFVEEVLGIHLFGENAWTTDGHEVNPGHMNAADNNMILPGAEGDEHIKHYYG